MAADLALLSLTHHQTINPNTGRVLSSWMWNPNQIPAAITSQEKDESWEVRAFAEDTGNIMGTTWPPRSYTCTFCRREFRSAQALGGHMNVHRRDRARLHQPQPNSKNPYNNISSNSSPTLLIPTQDIVQNGGLCLLYSLPNPNCNTLFSPLTSFTRNAAASPHPTTANLLNFPHKIKSSVSNSSNTEGSMSTNNHHNHHLFMADSVVEEIDLELRLGRSLTSPP